MKKEIFTVEDISGSEHGERIMKYDKIGDYLYYEFIHGRQVHQTLVADLTGISPNRLSEIIRHRRRITIDTDLRLCKFFGLEDGHFTKFQNQIETLQIKAKIKEELKKIRPYKAKIC